MFDEMHLDASLQYDSKNDCIIGFEDVGSERRRVLVFMARGIRKNWKQPMCFYFTDGGMK